LFRNHFFEPEDGPISKWEGRAIEIGKCYNFGKWKVSVHPVEAATDLLEGDMTKEAKRKEKAQALSLVDVIQGQFSYRMPTAVSYVTGNRSGFKPLLGVEVVVAEALPIVRGVEDIGQVRGQGPQVEVRFSYAPEK
jgi:hypothetical protein